MILNQVTNLTEPLCKRLHRFSLEEAQSIRLFPKLLHSIKLILWNASMAIFCLVNTKSAGQGQGRNQGWGAPGVCPPPPPPRKSGNFLVNPNVDCRKKNYSFSFLINYRSSNMNCICKLLLNINNC